MEENRYLSFYDVNIHQGNNVVKCSIPVGSFEDFARVFLNEKYDVGTYLVVIGMSVYDFETSKFI